MTEATTAQRRRLRAHFGFTKMPFHKAMRVAQMYDSQSQRELVAGLEMWTEIGGIALCSGPAGVGKSISLRRFLHGLDERRFHLVQFTYLPGTVSGSALHVPRSRPQHAHARRGPFDAAREHLASYEENHGPHPLIVIDDAEGLSVPVLDAVRRLAAHDLAARTQGRGRAPEDDGHRDALSPSFQWIGRHLHPGELAFSLLFALDEAACVVVAQACSDSNTSVRTKRPPSMSAAEMRNTTVASAPGTDSMPSSRREASWWVVRRGPHRTSVLCGAPDISKLR